MQASRGNRRRRRAAHRLLICAAALVPLAAVQAAGDAAPGLFGFTAPEAGRQRALEQRFDGALNPGDLRGWLRQLSSAPNQVGSPHDKANAETVRDLFRQWGWQAQIEVFEVLYPTLKQHSLELVAPTHFSASLSEPPVAGDATSGAAGIMPPYNVYGADGDVTGELVYANYGMPRDYQDLARRGIDVRGKIVITRYGGGWRGLKPKLAQEHGAIGCLIYSDPREDGYAQGDVYPKGGWRPPEGVQRGSVLDITLYSGDPLTPGVGATRDAKRLAIADAKTILKIPVMPISYADAQPLLAALGGAVAPPRWRGALPLTYHIGPGPARVHLAISSDWSLKPIYDVIAKIPGRESPNEWVVRGNHRDGWVFGAWDPLSGHVAMLAEAQAIGALVKSGWRPQRTLVYASWDGEEPGLLGSTEWAETHAAELATKAVLYLNSDTNARGFLSVGGSHALQHLVNEVARAVKDPETGVSAQARLRARMLTEGYERGSADDEDAEEAHRETHLAAAGGDLPIRALGSGSDYTPFLQHLGVTALNIEYHGEDDQAGVYHSAYDSFDHYVRFGDPGFAYGVAEAQTVGRVVLRMADADVLPLQFADFAETIGAYTEQLRHAVDERRRKAAELAGLLDQNDFALATDPTRPVAPPVREAPVPALDFAPLDAAVTRLKASARAYDAAYAQLLAGTVQLDAARRARLNALLQGMEQKLTDARGLPGREWYRHFLYAPGMLTGYGVKTLPGVREAIDGYRWDEAAAYIPITAAVLARYCDAIDSATALLKGG
ncbi:MAG TPA: transferrin receptor-like dimerization domain-containing protein [Steroidobacteraceae bacterium]|nr:M28 family peptidase [Gammaproteobacteria bacterium]HEV2285919.1 transferrin receptor-like dimerization domain-containing protein [Steroidobacteraceae bacterium]